MTGFEPRTSGVRSDCSINWAKTTAPKLFILKDPSFTELSVDWIACHPSGLTKYLHLFSTIMCTSFDEATHSIKCCCLTWILPFIYPGPSDTVKRYTKSIVPRCQWVSGTGNMLIGDSNLIDYPMKRFHNIVKFNHYLHYLALKGFTLRFTFANFYSCKSCQTTLDKLVNQSWTSIQYTGDDAQYSTVVTKSRWFVFTPPNKPNLVRPQIICKGTALWGLVEIHLAMA